MKKLLSIIFFVSISSTLYSAQMKRATDKNEIENKENENKAVHQGSYIAIINKANERTLVLNLIDSLTKNENERSLQNIFLKNGVNIIIYLKELKQMGVQRIDFKVRKGEDSYGFFSKSLGSIIVDNLISEPIDCITLQLSDKGSSELHFWRNR